MLPRVKSYPKEETKVFDNNKHGDSREDVGNASFEKDAKLEAAWQQWQLVKPLNTVMWSWTPLRYSTRGKHDISGL